DLRGRRPDRKHVQAQLWHQGQQPAAARAWGRDGSYRQSHRRGSGVRLVVVDGWLGCLVNRPLQVTVLGATGSIGLSTLDVVARHPQHYQAFALTAFSRIAELRALCQRHTPRYAVVADAEQARALQAQLLADGLQSRV